MDSVGLRSSNTNGIAKGADGNLWFTEHDARKIGRITPTGTITEFPIPSGSDAGYIPGSITAGPDGNVWYTEAGSANAIGRVTPAGAISEYPLPTPDCDPDGIAVGPDKNIWFTELSTNKIGRISNLTGGGAVGPSYSVGIGRVGRRRRLIRDDLRPALTLDCRSDGFVGRWGYCSGAASIVMSQRLVVQ
jgi:streptogramin lyase